MSSFSDKTGTDLRVHVPAREELKDVEEVAFNNHHRREREFVAEAGVSTTTIGSYVADRLVEAGADTFFSVPGDFVLGLLDSLLGNHRLKMIGCCNELNAGYAADGYCRGTGGLGVLVVTYMVGALSAINAIAGAYSDDLPVVIICGGPNTNDEHERHFLHHTLGERDLYQCSRCFEPVVAQTFVIRHIKDAAAIIDEAISTALQKKKPVYLEIPVNIVGQLVATPSPLSMIPLPQLSDKMALKAAADDILQRLTHAVKPVLIAGVKLRSAGAVDSFAHLAAALGCGVAVMPDAKGLFSEQDPRYMGTLWSGISSPYVEGIVDSSDLKIYAGPVFTDYSTVGWTHVIDPNKTIDMGPSQTVVCGRLYANVQLADLLNALAISTALPCKPFTLETFRRYVGDLSPPSTAGPQDFEAPLTLRELKRQLQQLLEEEKETSLIVETGDSWFIGQSMRLSAGTRYHFQMQYGSIGWAIGATLGVALGCKGTSRRVVALVGDGAFQCTAQEVSTMIRQQVRATIFLVNNNGYTIEIQIHDGPYNDIKCWDYAGLMNCFNASEGDGLGIRVKTCGELQEAMARAALHEGVTLVECIIDRNDCTAQLLEFGSKVAAANGRV